MIHQNQEDTTLWLNNDYERHLESQDVQHERLSNTKMKLFRLIDKKAVDFISGVFE